MKSVHKDMGRIDYEHLLLNWISLARLDMETVQLEISTWKRTRRWQVRHLARHLLEISLKAAIREKLGVADQHHALIGGMHGRIKSGEGLFEKYCKLYAANDLLEDERVRAGLCQWQAARNLTLYGPIESEWDETGGEREDHTLWEWMRDTVVKGSIDLLSETEVLDITSQVLMSSMEVAGRTLPPDIDKEFRSELAIVQARSVVTDSTGFQADMRCRQRRRPVRLPEEGT